MRNLFALLSLILMVTYHATAQQSTSDKPYSFTHNDISYLTDRVELPALDMQKLNTEDSLNAAKSLPFRVGIVRSTGYNMNNSGRLDILPDGAKLWRLTVRSPGATMMTVYFSSFHIPEQATFHIYSGDRSFLTGAYTNGDVQEDGILASDDIYGDEITIEYYEPADVPFHGTFEACRINHIYRNFNHHGQEGKGYWGNAQGDCHIDVVCPEGDPWRAQIRSVVCYMYTIGTNRFMCSGALINNVRMDKTPYVLTAQHCGGGDLSSYRFYFQYQTDSCGGTSGNHKRVANGAVICAADTVSTSSDFMLLKITGHLGQSYRDSIFFAGWDASGNESPGAGAAIHHPGGDFKKISIPEEVKSTAFPINLQYASNKFWRASWYPLPDNKGASEPGSSGSPLFNADGLIIGNLSSGMSSCENPTLPDVYGKIAYAWTNDNNPLNSKKLKPWLDPDNTGTLILQGMNYTDGPTDIRSHVQTVKTFDIIPNPSDGTVTFAGNFVGHNSICHIYNAMGILVATRDLHSASRCVLSFGNLSNGIYLVEIIDDNHVYKSKMVIAR